MSVDGRLHETLTAARAVMAQKAADRVLSSTTQGVLGGSGDSGGALVKLPSREPQEGNRKFIRIRGPGYAYSYCILGVSRSGSPLEPF